MIYVSYQTCNETNFFGNLIADPEDEEAIVKHKWFIRDGYQNLPHARIGDKLVSISRYILQQNNIDIPKDHIIKYIDGDTLNNTKSNLKVVKYSSIYQN